MKPTPNVIWLELDRQRAADVSTIAKCLIASSAVRNLDRLGRKLNRIWRR